MKLTGKAVLYGLILTFAVGVLTLMAVVRFAPTDPDKWNIPIADGTTATSGPCADHIRPQRNGARATCLLPASPAEVLTRLDTIALDTPRTQHVGGGPGGGRITWITRSRIMGYPDFTTAEVVPTAQGSRLDVYARQRFGAGDWGVNAARLRSWLTTLDHG